MRLQQFVEDKKEGQFSAMRLAFLLWAIGVFAGWAYASIGAGELRGIPESVVTILGLLAGGKVVQRYGEREAMSGPTGALDADEGLVQPEFTGTAAEYFRVWIVNLFFTLATLGIYSAWAKVRKRRYFYGSTRLDGDSFDYFASPKAILNGRIIAVAIFAIYALAGELY